jgi:hypothetical protein
MDRSSACSKKLNNKLIDVFERPGNKSLGLRYLMYWVQWKTLKARPAKKSLGLRYPATGLTWKPVLDFRYL